MSDKLRPFRACEVKLFQEPFTHGYIDNFLAPEMYARLQASFIDPEQSADGEVFKYGKRRILFVAPPAPQAIPADSPWSGFVDQITDSAYMQDLLQWIRESYLQSGRDPDDLYTKLMMSRFDIDPAELRMQCEFSSLEAGTHLEPHTDAEHKFISCILYLAPPQWQDEWGGATEAYRPKDPRHADNWYNRQLPLDCMETASRCEFRPNRLFFFVKTQDSWHGLSPVLAPVGQMRRTFNFSLQAPNPAFEKGPIPAYLKQVRKHEADIFDGGAVQRVFRKLGRVFGRA